MNHNVLKEALNFLNAAFCDEKLFPLDGNIPTSAESQLRHSERVDSERSLRLSVDQLISSFLLEQRRILLDNSPRSNLFRDRFVEARHFAEFLLRHGFSYDGSREQLLNFLLTEYWAQHGVLMLKHRMDGI